MQSNGFLEKHKIFEKKLMDMLLDGEQELFVKLKKQYEAAVVRNRDFDSYGFFTQFEVSDRSLVIPGEKGFTISDVIIDYDGQDVAYGSVLFIEHGFISCLEGHQFGGRNWIDDYDKIDDMYYVGETMERKLHKRDVGYLNEIGQNIPMEYLV
jgi:hypothetical protein